MVSLRVRHCLCIALALGISPPLAWSACPDCQYEKCGMFGVGCKCVPRPGCTIPAPITGITPKSSSPDSAPADTPVPPPPQVQQPPDQPGHENSIPPAKAAAKGASPDGGSVASYVCSGNGPHRTVTVSSTGRRCEAVYRTGGGAPQVIWRSSNEPGICATKAAAFVARLRSSNIRCTAR